MKTTLLLFLTLFSINAFSFSLFGYNYNTDKITSKCGGIYRSSGLEALYAKIKELKRPSMFKSKNMQEDIIISSPKSVRIEKNKIYETHDKQKARIAETAKTGKVADEIATKILTDESSANLLIAQKYDALSESLKPRLKALIQKKVLLNLDSGLSNESMEKIIKGSAAIDEYERTDIETAGYLSQKYFLSEKEKSALNSYRIAMQDIIL